MTVHMMQARALHRLALLYCMRTHRSVLSYELNSLLHPYIAAACFRIFLHLPAALE